MTLCATQKVVLSVLALILLNISLVYLGLLLNFLFILPTLLPIIDGLGVMIVAFWNKWWSKQDKQTALLIGSLRTFREELGFIGIEYCNGKIVKAAYREPQVQFMPEIKRLLRKNNLDALLNQLTKEATELQSKAETLMVEFQEIINQNLKSLELKKSADIAGERLAKNTYSLSKIYQAIFDEIIGEKSKFKVDDGYLWHGDTKIARNGDSLDKLKCIAEKLVKDDILIGKAIGFKESKTKLNSGALFLQLKIALKKIIEQLQWNNPGGKS